MAKFLTLDNLEVKNKVALVRVDFNSPVDPETKKISMIREIEPMENQQ